MKEGKDIRDVLEFFTEQGERTVISQEFLKMFDGADRPTEIVEVVQALLVHKVRIKNENKNHEGRLSYTEEGDPAYYLKTISDIETRLEKYKPVVATCRSYTMLLVAVLRSKGVPARSRCGFSIYFGGGNYEDHWICEYWSKEGKEWIQVDAQMDEYWRRLLKLNNKWFDPFRLKKGQFFSGGLMWRLYRDGLIDPQLCGFGPEGAFGEYYIRGNLIRDLFALSKLETSFGRQNLFMKKHASISPRDLKLLDEVAEVTTSTKLSVGSISELAKKVSQYGGFYEK